MKRLVRLNPQRGGRLRLSGQRNESHCQNNPIAADGNFSLVGFIFFRTIQMNVHGICSRKNIWLFVGASVKKLMPFVATGEFGTDVQFAFAPRLIAA